MGAKFSVIKKLKALFIFACVMGLYLIVVEYIYKGNNPPLESFSYDKDDAKKLQRLCLSLDSTYHENYIDNSTDLSVRQISFESEAGRRLYYWVPKVPDDLAVPRKNYCQVILDGRGYVLKAEFIK
ncbi:hypothetical protein BTJ40_10925 [Microbulbifer sp. A4B17]|uniref:hypothetical protein n=1 Tax=Microbulbifer sp. A4B17 TaxID=359370 RepID=UPI000D52E680|nr:hypothetical protein [Microbulbifer sp. A4B17]AWF81289.1 hypothetical protein BTJ40_10925 [Microbulbifer sp. A4B17]